MVSARGQPIELRLLHVHQSRSAAGHGKLTSQSLIAARYWAALAERDGRTRLVLAGAATTAVKARVYAEFM
jgi:hypothetical protein